MSALTLGPLLYPWPPEQQRDFYFRVADEAPVETVVLGEVVCAKRASFFDAYGEDIINRLQGAGKQIVFSTLSLITSDREREAVREQASSGLMIEANDIACVQALEGKPHIIGPFVNVFNEDTRDFLAAKGATRVVLPVELSLDAQKAMAQTSGACETEVLAFGRQPLAVSMRCYHARAYDLHKDTCQFACTRDPDGLPVNTLTQQPLLSISGTHTFSHGYAVLMTELAALCQSGVTHFRLSPQTCDMVAVASLFRRVLDGLLAPHEGLQNLRGIAGNVSFINGYSRGREGLAWEAAG